MINQVFNEDCLDGMKRIPDKSVDVVVTDPPYKVISGGKGIMNRDGQMLEKNDGKIFTHNDIKLEQWIPEVYRVMKDGTHFYTMTNTLNLENTLKVCRETGFGLHNLLMWRKNNQVLNRWYMKSCEYILFLYKKPAKKINTVGTSQVLEFKNPTNKIHPTEKPTALMKVLIENSSNENDTILDPFMGSGTTAIACIDTKRKYIGFEVDKGYYDIIQKRIADTMAARADLLEGL